MIAERPPLRVGARRGPPALGALAIALAAGCAGPPPVADDSIFAVVGPAGEALAVRGEDLYSFAPGEQPFEVALGDDPGSMITLTGSTSTEHGAEFAIAESDGAPPTPGAGGAEPRRVEFLARGDGGETILVAVLEADRHSLTRFDPPLVVAPAELAPGETRRAESDMTVLDARSRERVRERGRAERSIAHEGAERLRTPGGEVTAQRIAVEFTADLRLADAHRRDVFWVVPGVGVVACTSDEAIEVLGLPGETHLRTIVRKTR
jgi:hypothetical protein